MKWALIALLTLGALGAWAMGLKAAGGLSGEVKPMPMPKVPMRAWPQLSGSTVAVAAAAPAPAKPEPKPEPVAAPAPKPEPVKPEVAKPEPVAPAPKPEPVAKPAPAPAPVQPKPAPAPAPEAAPKPAVAAPAPAAAPPPPAEQGEGTVNLKASDTAEIVIDGRKIGPSPKLGLKLKAGRHKIRFDCYDENGNLKPGKLQQVDLKADEERDVDYECPFAQ
ncbi:MAG: hypothetical protein IPJ65_22605 [Archangiaceae bacterium]|nr:hypothetical protein [Archangiaceae bacterium]